jgi:hypothetical protein
MKTDVNKTYKLSNFLYSPKEKEKYRNKYRVIIKNQKNMKISLYIYSIYALYIYSICALYIYSIYALYIYSIYALYIYSIYAMYIYSIYAMYIYSIYALYIYSIYALYIYSIYALYIYSLRIKFYLPKLLAYQVKVKVIRYRPKWPKGFLVG